MGDVTAELEGWARLTEPVSREAVVSALEHASVRLPGARDPGYVAVLDLLRVRTRRFAAVFLLGLEEGTFPRRATETPFLSDDARRELEAKGRGRRLVRPDQLARDRYLFYTACTRPWKRLTLVREAASDDGRPREPSPFYEEVRSRFAPAEVDRWTTPASAVRTRLGRWSGRRPSGSGSGPPRRSRPGTSPRRERSRPPTAGSEGSSGRWPRSPARPG